MGELKDDTGDNLAETPFEDLVQGARGHYDKVSTNACEWLSTIPQAIDAWEACGGDIALVNEALALIRKLARSKTDGDVDGQSNAQCRRFLEERGMSWDG